MKFAINSGAEFLDNAYVTSVSQNSDHVEISLLDERKYQAKYCIVADGSQGRIGNYLRNVLRLEQRWKQKMGLSLVEDIPIESTFIEENYGYEKKAVLYFKYEYLKGYAWAFPKKHSVNIGFVGPLKEMKADGDVKKKFQLFIQFLKSNNYLPNHCYSKKVKGGFIPWGGIGT